jgi:hypothetical protein
MARFRASDLLRRLFETVLQRASKVWSAAKAFAVDASLIRADVSERIRVLWCCGAAAGPGELY